MPVNPKHILIIDERQGNVITDDIQEKIDAAHIVLVIQPDNHVELRKNSGKVGVIGLYERAPHRDEISAEKSKEADRRREAALVEREAATSTDSAMTKVRRALGHEV